MNSNGNLPGSFSSNAAKFVAGGIK
jgi:hypothetical protein